MYSSKSTGSNSDKTDPLDIPPPTFSPSINCSSSGSDSTSSKKSYKRPTPKESSMLRDVVFVEDVQSIPVGRRVLKIHEQNSNESETKDDIGCHDYRLMKENDQPIIKAAATSQVSHCHQEAHGLSDQTSMKEMPVELTNITGTNLYDLNDDCLIEIFKSFDWMDLCSVAETCKRFQQLAQHIIPKELEVEENGNNFKLQPVRSTKLAPYETNDEGSVERIFKNFGSIFNALDIIQNDDFDFLSDIIAEHCVGNLKRLKIIGKELHLTKKRAKKFKPVLKQLLALDLNRVSTDDKTFLVDMNELIELRFYSKYNDVSMTNNIFVKLEKFAFDYPFDYGGKEYDAKSLTTFISRHQTLKAIDLDIASISNGMKKIIVQTIVKSCIEVEELRLFFGDWNCNHLKPLQSLQSLESLKCLRTLKLYKWSFVNGLDSLKNLRELRQLSLDRCLLPQHFTEFNSVVQLTKLGMVDCKINQTDLVYMIGRLTKLEELIIRYYNGFALNEETFLEILGIVKDRPNVLTLMCDEFKFDLNVYEGKNRNVKLVKLTVEF